jgi:hypothetical protein
MRDDIVEAAEGSRLQSAGQVGVPSSTRRHAGSRLRETAGMESGSTL